jgi:hypothetical protein
MTDLSGLYQFTLRSENIWGRMEERVYVGARLPDEVAAHVLRSGEIAITCDRPGVLPFRVLKRAHVTGVKRVVSLKTDQAQFPESAGGRGSTLIASEPGVDSHLKALYKAQGQAHNVIPAVKPDRAWRVPSRSKPSEKHLVTLTGRAYRCDCAGFQYRSHCSHITTIADMIRKGMIK